MNKIQGINNSSEISSTGTASIFYIVIPSVSEQAGTQQQTGKLKQILQRKFSTTNKGSIAAAKLQELVKFGTMDAAVKNLNKKWADLETFFNKVATRNGHHEADANRNSATECENQISLSFISATSKQGGSKPRASSKNPVSRKASPANPTRRGPLYSGNITVLDLPMIPPQHTSSTAYIAFRQNKTFVRPAPILSVQPPIAARQLAAALSELEEKKPIQTQQVVVGDSQVRKTRLRKRRNSKTPLNGDSRATKR
jgi:hypothetical protein